MAARARVKRKKLSVKRPVKRLLSAGKARRRPAASGVVEAALAVFAHEVRTPLTGILAISDLLATSELGERERRWIDTIKAGAEHLASLATLFVDAAKHANGPVRIAPGSVRPAGARAKCRRLAGRARGGQGVAVEDRDRLEPAVARGRRSGAPSRRAREPDRQCGEVHRERRCRLEGRAGARRKGQGRRQLRGVRQRDRTDAAGDQAAVPSVLAGQCEHRLALRRRRARSVLGQAVGARDGGRRRGHASAAAAARR